MPDLPSASPRGDRNAFLDQEIALAGIRSPLLLKALALWNALRGTRPFPARREVTPRAMLPFLRNTVLIAIIGDGLEYQFRVVGDAIVQAQQGQSFQGMTMAEIDARLPGYGSLLRPVYDRLRDSGAAMAYRGDIRAPGSDRAIFFETLLLPFGETDRADHILVVADFDQAAKPA
jgi:hypothetical protein